MKSEVVKLRASNKGISLADAVRELEYEDLLERLAAADTRAKLQVVVQEVVGKLHKAGVL